MKLIKCQILRINTPEIYNEDLYLIFNLQQANYIREQRIHGRFIGSVQSIQTAASTNRKTNNHLPFKLTESEVGLVLENINEDYLEILIQEQMNVNNLDAFNEKFQSYKDKLVELKNADYIKLRKEQLNKMRNKILTAKRKKLNENLKKLADDKEAQLKVFF